VPVTSDVRVRRQLLREIDVARGDELADHSLEPEPLSSSGENYARDAESCSSLISYGTMTPPPPPNTLIPDVAARWRRDRALYLKISTCRLIRRDRDARARLPCYRSS
jgi:hypothetical protein